LQNEPNFLEWNQHLAAHALAAPAVIGGAPSSPKTHDIDLALDDVEGLAFGSNPSALLRSPVGAGELET
jgi:hypothetical protein